MQHPVVSRDDWLAARKVLLAKELAITHELDALRAERRQLPWVRVEKDYSAKDLQRMNLAKNTLVSESGKVVRVAASAIYSPKELHRLSLSGNSTVTVASFPPRGKSTCRTKTGDPSDIVILQGARQRAPRETAPIRPRNLRWRTDPVRRKSPARPSFWPSRTDISWTTTGGSGGAEWIFQYFKPICMSSRKGALPPPRAGWASRKACAASISRILKRLLASGC